MESPNLEKDSIHVINTKLRIQKLEQYVSPLPGPKAWDFHFVTSAIATPEWTVRSSPAMDADCLW